MNREPCAECSAPLDPDTGDCNSCAIDALRAALAEVTRERDEYKRQAALYHADMMKVREQRDEARAHEAQMSENHALMHSMWTEETAKRKAAESALERANADAAAMRRVIERTHDRTCVNKQLGIPCLWCSALDTSAGTALLARLKAADALAIAAHELCDWVQFHHKVKDVKVTDALAAYAKAKEGGE